MRISPKILGVCLMLVFSPYLLSAQSRFPVINRIALYLPKPNYPNLARDFCANGEVRLSVSVGRRGRVTSVAVVSGDYFLHDAAEAAAKRAIFSQKFVGRNGLKMGILVFNFGRKYQCFDAGVINKKAISVPRPIFSAESKAVGKVEVRIVLDAQTAKIVRVKAISGPPRLYPAAEASAARAKFAPTNDIPKVMVKGSIIYDFKPTGEVEF
jgi:TonB family protein